MVGDESSAGSDFWHRVAHSECESTAEIFSFLSYLISIAGEHTVLKGPLLLLWHYVALLTLYHRNKNVSN